MPILDQLEPGDFEALATSSPPSIRFLRAFSRYTPSASHFTVFADHLQSTRLDIVILPFNLQSDPLCTIYTGEPYLTILPAPSPGPHLFIHSRSSTSVGARPMAPHPPSPPSMSWASSVTPLPPSSSTIHP